MVRRQDPARATAHGLGGFANRRRTRASRVHFHVKGAMSEEADVFARLAAKQQELERSEHHAFALLCPCLSPPTNSLFANVCLDIPMKPPALLIVTRIMSSRLSHVALAVRRAIQELQALEDVRIPASPCCALCNHCAQYKSVTSCPPERAPPFPAHEPSFPIASHGRTLPDPPPPSFLSSRAALAPLVAACRKGTRRLST